MSDFGKFDVSLEADVDQALSADDNYMLETLFRVCDVQSTGEVRISKIISYLKQNALPDTTESAEALEELARLFDPGNGDPLIAKDTYKRVIRRWISSLKYKKSNFSSEFSANAVVGIDHQTENPRSSYFEEIWNSTDEEVPSSSFLDITDRDKTVLLSRMSQLQLENRELYRQSKEAVLQVEAIEDSNQQLEQEISELRKKVISNQNIAENNKHLLEENEELMSTVSELRQAKNRIQGKNVQLERDNIELEKNLKELHEMLDKSYSSLEELKTVKQEAYRTLDEHKQSRFQTDYLVLELSSLKADLAQTRLSAKRTDAINNKLTNENDSLRKIIADLEKALSEESNKRVLWQHDNMLNTANENGQSLHSEIQSEIISGSHRGNIILPLPLCDTDPRRILMTCPEVNQPFLKDLESYADRCVEEIFACIYDRNGKNSTYGKNFGNRNYSTTLNVEIHEIKHDPEVLFATTLVNGIFKDIFTRYTELISASIRKYDHQRPSASGSVDINITSNSIDSFVNISLDSSIPKDGYSIIAGQAATVFEEKKVAVLNQITHLLSSSPNVEREGICRDLENELNNFSNKISVLAYSKNKLEKRLASVNLLLEKLREENNSLRYESRILADKLNNSRHYAIKLELRLDSLQSSLVEERDRCTILEAELKDLRISTLHQSDEIKALTTSLETQMNYRSSLDEQFKESKLNNRDLQAQNLLLTDQLSELQRELEVLGKRNWELERSLELATSRYGKDQEDITGFEERSKRCATDNEESQRPLARALPTLDNDDAFSISEKQLLAFKEMISKIDRTTFSDTRIIDNLTKEFVEPVYITLSRKPFSKASFGVICPNIGRLPVISLDSEEQQTVSSYMQSSSSRSTTGLHLFSIISNSTELAEDVTNCNQKSSANIYIQTEIANLQDVSVQTNQQKDVVYQHYFLTDPKLTLDVACQTDIPVDSEYVNQIDSDSLSQVTSIQRTLNEFKKVDEDKEIIRLSAMEKWKHSVRPALGSIAQSAFEESEEILKGAKADKSIYRLRCESDPQAKKLGMADIAATFTKSARKVVNNAKTNSMLRSATFRESTWDTYDNIEDRYTRLVLAFKTDQSTMSVRLSSQERSLKLTESNANKEIIDLRNVIKILNRLITDLRIKEVIRAAEDYTDVLEKCLSRIISKAESLGSVQQEENLSMSIKILISYSEHLKRQIAGQKEELEEARKRRDEQALQNTALRTIGAMPSIQTSHARLRHRKGVTSTDPIHSQSPRLDRRQSLGQSFAQMAFRAAQAIGLQEEEEKEGAEKQEVVKGPMRRRRGPVIGAIAEENPDSNLEIVNQDNHEDATTNNTDIYQQGFEKGLQTRISNEMEEMHEQQDAIEANVRMLTERANVLEEKFTTNDIEKLFKNRNDNATSKDMIHEAGSWREEFLISCNNILLNYRCWMQSKYGKKLFWFLFFIAIFMLICIWYLPLSNLAKHVASISHSYLSSTRSREPPTPT